MKYSCSKEGVKELRGLNNSLNESIITIHEIIAETKTALEPYAEALGPHYDLLVEAMDNVAESMSSSYNSVEAVKLALEKVIVIYEEVISKTPNYIDQDADNGTAYSIGAKTR